MLVRRQKRLEKKGQVTKIMVFGTFDVLHPGHLHFFKQARALARKPFLVVSVARDVNVKRIKKQKPLHNEKYRLKIVKQSPLVDKAVLGGTKDHLKHILKEKPRIIALGHDQHEYTVGLGSKLKKQGLIVKVVRLKPHNRRLYRSSIIKNSLKLP